MSPFDPLRTLATQCAALTRTLARCETCGRRIGVLAIQGAFRSMQLKATDRRHATAHRILSNHSTKMAVPLPKQFEEM